MDRMELYKHLSLARVESINFVAGNLRKIILETEDGVRLEVTGDMDVKEVI